MVCLWVFCFFFLLFLVFFLLFETGLVCYQDSLSVQCLVIFYFEFKLQVYTLSLQSSTLRLGAI